MKKFVHQYKPNTRSSSGLKFGRLLSRKSRELKANDHECGRLFRVEAPEEGGTVTLVFAVDRESTDFRAFSISPEGEISGWWNWSEHQI